MRTMIILFAVAFFLPVIGARAEPSATTYFVQLIQGTDSSASPSRGARLVGPTLSRQFDSVFRKKNYWEMSRREVIARVGQPIKVSLNGKREVAIEITDVHRIVTTFYDGHIVTRRTDPRGEAMTLIGDGHGTNSFWFIVVRRDKPSS